MFYFMKNNHKIIVKCRWWSGCVVSSALGSWQSPGGVSGGKTPEKSRPFYIWRANEQLKIEETSQSNLF